MLESMSTKDSARNVLWGAGIAAALSLATTGLAVHDFAGRSYERNPNYIKGVVCAESRSNYNYSFDVNSPQGVTSFSIPLKGSVEALACDASVNIGDEIKVNLKYGQDPSRNSQIITLDQIITHSK